MKDFVGQQLNEGDYVAFIRPDYPKIVSGKIAKLNFKQVYIQWRPEYAGAPLLNAIVDATNTVKLEATDVLAKILKG